LDAPLELLGSPVPSSSKKLCFPQEAKSSNMAANATNAENIRGRTISNNLENCLFTIFYNWS